jgi:DNA-binding ferritin-like protein
MERTPHDPEQQTCPSHPDKPELRAPLQILLDAARAVRECALELGDAATADRLADRIAALERQLAASPPGQPDERIARHPN